jgi:hypothetical protein
MTNFVQLDPIEGLLQYILDIKPYHSKIAEVLVDYSVNDDVAVTILDSWQMDAIFVEDYNDQFACDEGYGVLPFGDQDMSIGYMPDLTINGYLTHSGISLQLPIVYIDPFVFSFYTIINVVSGINGTWIVSGNHANELVAGHAFMVEGNAGGGNGTYIIGAASNVGPDTHVDIIGSIPLGASSQGTAHINTGSFFIEGNYASTFTVGSNFTIQGSYANNGVWLVISATNETGIENPPGFDPAVNLTEVKGVFISPYHTFEPIFGVPSAVSPFQFQVAGGDFDQHYSVGDVFQIVNFVPSPLVTPTYNNSSWLITAITPVPLLSPTYFVIEGTHVFDAAVGTTTVSPVLNPFLIAPVVKVETTTETFYITGNHVADFGVGTFFIADDVNNVSGNQGKWQVVTVVYDPVNNQTLISSSFDQILYTGTAGGEVLVYLRSNWDLPEICKTASQTTTSSFIGETLEFIQGTEFIINELVSVEICDLTSGVGWGAGGSTEMVHIIGGNQGLKEIFVAYDITYNLVLTNPGSQSISFSSPTVITPTPITYNSPTGLLANSTIYTATITIDGIPHSVSAPGLQNQDFRELINTINAAISGFGLATVSAGTILIISATTGLTSSVSVADTGVNPLFASMVYTVVFNTPLPSSTLIQIVDSSGNNGVYNVTDVTYIPSPGNYTRITVLEPIPSATFDGSIVYDPFIGGLLPQSGFTSPIVGVTIGLNGTVTFSGNHAAVLIPGGSFVIDGNFDVLPPNAYTSANGIFYIQSVINVGPNTQVTVTGTIPADAAVNGYAIFPGLLNTAPVSSVGWDDCGWDTQANVTLYQYRLAVAPPTDTFVTYSPDGGTVVAHGFSTGDVVTVSGALPIPLPLIADLPYYVFVVSTTSFKLATSSANLAANIFITATTTGNVTPGTGYQFVERDGAFLNYEAGATPGNLINTYANASFTENLTIAVTFGIDAGTVIGSWDYPYWDVGSYDEDVDVLLSLYGPNYRTV